MSETWKCAQCGKMAKTLKKTMWPEGYWISLQLDVWALTAVDDGDIVLGWEEELLCGDRCFTAFWAKVGQDMLDQGVSEKVRVVRAMARG